MFRIGEHIVYGTNGVCLVRDICPSPFDSRDTRTYYVLKPLHSALAELIYTPTDNDRVSMRRLLTREEAEALFSRMGEIAPLSFPNERQRREIYRSVLATCEPDAYVSIIKTVLQRRQEIAQGSSQRRLPDFEVEYDSVARRNLHTELAFVLELPAEGVESYILDRVSDAVG